MSVRVKRVGPVAQVFATKSDLLPPQYVAALKSVFDDCPAVDPKRVRKIVEEELGGPVGELFHDFSHEVGVCTQKMELGRPVVFFKGGSFQIVNEVELKTGFLNQKPFGSTLDVCLSTARR